MAIKLPENYKEVETIIVRETKDYRFFKTPDYNRKNRDNLKRTASYKALKMRINKDGQYDPIIVAKDSTVISGATRLSVCEDLGIAVKFIVVNKSARQLRLHMLDAGLTTRKWTAIDNANFWDVWGCSVYGDILNAVEKSGISISHIGKISTAAGEPNIAIGSDEFKYGGQPEISSEELMSHAMAASTVATSPKFNSKRVIINIFKWLVVGHDLEFATEVFSVVASKLHEIEDAIPKSETIRKFEELYTSSCHEHLDLPARLEDQ